mgnify:CR=1 FL=1
MKKIEWIDLRDRDKRNQEANEAVKRLAEGAKNNREGYRQALRNMAGLKEEKKCQ